MSSATLTLDQDVWRPKYNPWLIAVVVALGAFMEVLDTSIANVALPYMAGNLGASNDQSTWVLTSYLVSNAIILPISGWLASTLGRKRFFMACLTVFTISSLLCGIASMLGRVRSYQDKVFWGTAGNARHGVLPQKELDHYLRERIVFDTAGFCGALGSIRTALVELPASRIVFATDYPQEIRAREAVRDFVRDIRTLGAAGEQILSGNVGLLLRNAP